MTISVHDDATLVSKIARLSMKIPVLKLQIRNMDRTPQISAAVRQPEIPQIPTVLQSPVVDNAALRPVQAPIIPPPHQRSLQEKYSPPKNCCGADEYQGYA
ncbi:hypothetical protein D9757_005119 [Collybiopsis confluens]|uniref:Uncharacterized protein n=1 Tax=Collybiopsis confluens TaxID=2823264 RepID=A0A8H5HTE5_9AGAR|nr:hypothetical protein D9757_005119 [Collybiopsis confluens]